MAYSLCWCFGWCKSSVFNHWLGSRPLKLQAATNRFALLSQRAPAAATIAQPVSAVEFHDHGWAGHFVGVGHAEL
jgi:hypothetical protein